jgi:ribose 1,5-bisphosphate isomerase
MDDEQIARRVAAIRNDTERGAALLAGEAVELLAGIAADTIMAGGAVVNKAGTMLLALAARRCYVPLHTLANTQKIAPSPGRRHRMPFTIEEHDAEEVLPEPIKGVAVRNAYFDLTPGRYVTGYITEDGLARSPRRLRARPPRPRVHPAVL